MTVKERSKPRRVETTEKAKTRKARLIRLKTCPLVLT